MPSAAIADTGLLYALFDADDKHHARAAALLKSGRYELLTSMAVVTETMHMLKRCPVETRVEFLHWVRQGGVQIIDLLLDDLVHIAGVLLKFADLPADFADATIVAVADRLKVNQIATFDRDFDVYRYRNRARFRNVLR